MSNAARVEDDPPDEPRPADLPEEQRPDSDVSATRRPAFRVTALGMFGAAFLFLLGAAVAIVLAQFFPGYRAPVLSIVYSAAAVLCAVAALSLRR